MAFQPVGELHAIQEVVFVAQFQRTFSHSEIETFAALHSDLSSELPKLDRPAVYQIVLGDHPHPGAPPPSTVSFQSFRRDGTLDWRLMVSDSWVAVNCLSYTRWAAVKMQAHRYLSLAVAKLISEGNAVSAIALQYIDIFLWRDAGKPYDLSSLLDFDSDYISKKILTVGPNWHLNQGFFDFDEGFPNSPILNNININSMVTQVPETKVDTTHKIDFSNTPIRSSDDYDSISDKCFEMLHKKNKLVLGDLLTDDMKQRISFGEA